LSNTIVPDAPIARMNLLLMLDSQNFSAVYRNNR